MRKYFVIKLVACSDWVTGGGTYGCGGATSVGAYINQKVSEILNT